MLMKTLEINEKRRKNLGVILTKVLISMLIIALKKQSLSQSNARTQWADMKTNLFEYSLFLMKLMKNCRKIKG